MNAEGGGIKTYLSGSTLTDSDNNWSLASEKPATSAHWGAEKTYDFFYNTYGRNSFDGVGQLIEIYTNETFGGTYPGLNAQWDQVGERFRFGNGHSGIANAVVCLDVVGHEFTHAVDDHEANLVDIYEGEPGALAESFADIFGIMAEYYAGSGDYEMGEEYMLTTDTFFTNTYKRSLSNPNTYKDPDTYNGTHWINTTDLGNDNGGVHTNSGVQNFWFYLLSEGGSGTNDHSYSYNVSGITRTKAAAIAYRSLTSYLTSASDFADAKNGAIFSAMDLYGTCSNEVLQTVKAWNAVGVSSATGNGYNLTVNCTDLNFWHNGDPPYRPAYPYTARAINSLTANCAISANGQPVSFIAKTITLSPGFESGNNFWAYADPCLAAANKMGGENHESNENETVSIDHGGVQILDSIRAKRFSVFPNPNEGQFTLTVSIEEQETFSIHVHNITGQLIYEKDNYSENTLDFDLSKQPKGMYFVNIILKDKVYSEKVIID